MQPYSEFEFIINILNADSIYKLLLSQTAVVGHRVLSAVFCFLLSILIGWSADLYFKDAGLVTNRIYSIHFYKLFYFKNSM